MTNKTTTLQPNLRYRVIPLEPTDREAEHRWRKKSAAFWQSSKDNVRTTYDRYTKLTPPAKGVQFEKANGSHIQGWWVRPNGATEGRVLLYLHGGGYGLGSAEAYCGFVSQIADRAQISVFVLEYPLAPEATVPSAYNLAIEVREWLASQGFKQLAIIGDSAGGGLTLASLATHSISGSTLVRSSLPVVGCVVFSPWTDLSVSGASRDLADPVLALDYMLASAKQYLGDADPHDPRASPLFGIPFGLPPIYIQVGSDEMLVDDSKRYASVASQLGADIRLEIWEGMHHVFQQHTEDLESGRKALDACAYFLLQQFEENHW